MKARFAKVFILSFVLISISVSVTGQMITGTGEIVKQVRETANFNAISNSTSADIVVEQSEKAMIVVKTDKALIEYVVTKVENNTLIINVNRNFRKIDVIEILVTVPDLNSVSINGSGDFVFSGVFSTDALMLNLNGSGDLNGNLKTNKVKIDVRGSGDIDVVGINDELSLYMTGSGDVRVRKLQLNKCTVVMTGSGDLQLEGSVSLLVSKLSGSGDMGAYDLNAAKVDVVGNGSGNISVSVSDYLKAALNGSGSIYYKGNPAKVKISEKGSGEIIQR